MDHLHVPLQSGCDATLKRMNRKYTTAQYLEKINKIQVKLMKNLNRHTILLKKLIIVNYMFFRIHHVKIHQQLK